MNRPQCAADASHDAAAGACRSFTATQLSIVRTPGAASARRRDGMRLEELLHLGALLTRAEAANAPTMRGMPWKMPSVRVSVSQFSLTNAQAASCEDGRPSRPPISVAVSCVRTSGEIANCSVRCTSAGSRNHGSALKKR